MPAPVGTYQHLAPQHASSACRELALDASVPGYRTKGVDLIIGEALLLADQLREWTRDDPRLAPRTIRLRALLDELLEPAAGAESIAEVGGT